MLPMSGSSGSEAAPRVEPLGVVPHHRHRAHGPEAQLGVVRLHHADDAVADEDGAAGLVSEDGEAAIGFSTPLV